MILRAELILILYLPSLHPPHLEGLLSKIQLINCLNFLRFLSLLRNLIFQEYIPSDHSNFSLELFLFSSEITEEILSILAY